MFTQPEIEMLNDAITLALQSNKRMQNSKPKFAQIFNQIENDLNALKIKITQMQQKAAK